MSQPISYLSRFLLDRDPLALFAPDPTTGTVTDLTGNYTATLTNGATVTSDSLAEGHVGAVSLDGSNDYVATTAGTRRNLIAIPSPKTNIIVGSKRWSHFAGAGGATGVAVTRVAGSLGGGLGSGTGFYCRFAGTHSADGANNLPGCEWMDNSAAVNYQDRFVPVTPGRTYTFGVDIEIVDPTSGYTPQVAVYWMNNAGSVISSLTANLNATARYVLKGVAPVGAVTAIFRPVVCAINGYTTNGDTFEYRFDAATFDDGDTDGSRYPTQAQVDSGEAGFLGTAWESLSDKGILANGTTRTIAGLARTAVDAPATNSQQVIWGSNLLTGSTASFLRLFTTSGGVRRVDFILGNTTYTWNLTADEVAASVALRPFFWRLEFNEVADTAVLQINDLPAVSKSSVTAQHSASQSIQFGAYASTGAGGPFPGLLVPAGIYADAWTAAEHRMANVIREHGGPFRVRRRR